MALDRRRVFAHGETCAGIRRLRSPAGTGGREGFRGGARQRTRCTPETRRLQPDGARNHPAVRRERFSARSRALGRDRSAAHPRRGSAVWRPTRGRARTASSSGTHPARPTRSPSSSVSRPEPPEDQVRRTAHGGRPGPSRHEDLTRRTPRTGATLSSIDGSPPFKQCSFSSSRSIDANGSSFCSMPRKFKW